MVVAHERGVLDQIECIRSVAATTAPNPAIMRDNPLNKIPTLVLPDGVILLDSRVICEFLDTLGEGPSLFPPAGAERWRVLSRQALADGLMDLSIAFRGEQHRAAPTRSSPHLEAYSQKVTATLDRLERDAPALHASIDIADIAVAVALSYLDFRFEELNWRQGRSALAAWHQVFAKRPSMLATAIVDDGDALGAGAVEP